MNMKNVFLLVAVLLSSGVSHASFFSDEVDVQEAANALAHCSDAASGLVAAPGSYIGGIIGKHTKISDRVDRKVVVFNGVQGGYVMGPGPKVVEFLNVIATVTQPPPYVMDAPASVEWKCESGTLN
jgi:hypothetical protein